MRREFNAVRLDGDGISYSAGSSTSPKISGHLLMLSGMRAVISSCKTSNIDISGTVSQSQFERWVSERLRRIGDGVAPSSLVCVILGIYDQGIFISLKMRNMVDREKFWYPRRLKLQAMICTMMKTGKTKSGSETMAVYKSVQLSTLISFRLLSEITSYYALYLLAFICFGMRDLHDVEEPLIRCGAEDITHHSSIFYLN